MKTAAEALSALARAASPVAEGADLTALHARLVGELLAAIAGAIATGRALPGEGIEALLAGSDALPLERATRDRALAAARAEAAALALDPHAPERLGGVYEATTATALARDDEGRLTVVFADRRRRGGCHYTSPALATRIVEIALGPLLAAGADPRALRVVDPAMGSGACLLAALRWLSARARPGEERGARRDVAAVLEGLDVDPAAARVAAASLWLAVGDRDLDPAAATPGLRMTDGLSDEGARGADAFVGNPPWVSYVGRAAQPLDPMTRARFGASFAAFAGYRNLQGLFLERAASLLRPGGRLALLVPSSMAEQQGYAPTRRALDTHCAVDAELVDVGEDAFEGVFQPCLIVAATRRVPVSARVATGLPWPVERPDLDAGDRALLDRLAALPPLPPERFGERGVQTSGDDVADMAMVADARRTMPLRAGGDIEAFILRPPSRFADGTRFPPRFRAGPWGEVAVLVRQTAAWPTAARSDGLPFRNSLLAAFAGEGWSPELMVAWLNSTPVRWHHYMRFRDARQGMPQVKVSHLRAVPAPLPGARLAAVEAIGAALSQRNAGIDEATQHALDDAVAAALGLEGTDRARIAAWWRARCAPRRPRAAGLRT